MGAQYKLQLITDIRTMVMACLGDVRGSNEKQTKHFMFKYSATITYPPNKIIFLGTELVGAEFVAAKLVGSRVGKGPNLLGLLRAEMSRNR